METWMTPVAEVTVPIVGASNIRTEKVYSDGHLPTIHLLAPTVTAEQPRMKIAVRGTY